MMLNPNLMRSRRAERDFLATGLIVVMGLFLLRGVLFLGMLVWGLIQNAH